MASEGSLVSFCSMCQHVVVYKCNNFKLVVLFAYVTPYVVNGAGEL